MNVLKTVCAPCFCAVTVSEKVNGMKEIMCIEIQIMEICSSRLMCIYSHR